MPRYFFNVHDGQPPLEQDPPDHDGTVLPSAEAARSQAVILAGEMLKDLDGQFWKGGDWQLDVTDEGGASICTLRFSGTTGDEPR